MVASLAWMVAELGLLPGDEVGARGDTEPDRARRPGS
jgi:hypothetical protein